MGKASRLKRERNAAKVYRFIKEESHANALVNGNVWINTLEKCRAYEDPLQGDEEEAVHRYNSGYIMGGSDDPSLMVVAARCSINIGPGCPNITLNNNTSVHRIPDAFVLCATEFFNPKELNQTFGMYCVEISNPNKFFQLLTMKLRELHQIRQAAWGKVIYRKRNYSGLEDPPGPLGFVKPADPYSVQREVRFLWTINSARDLLPFLLEVPEVTSLCRRIA
ncbi:hypothetical protein [Chitinimonas sp. BJB300]|uniref:hypothetical protein n=1 Tax=Chitinimonas sp. BJB300 TaxID=1559339 RepID=UPI00111220A8|nr:hypothetical protein [Chitinimonas sp. BJB300]TSJ83887.1 hypothetical protein FG002_020380 [Chitinimonas sp. BJB300]